MGWRKVLIAALAIAFAIELLWPVGGFLAPEQLLGAFKITPAPDTLFLTFVLAWCLLFVALVCGLALRLVLKNDPHGWTLSYLLGLWWVGIGGTLFLVHGKVENLFLDGLKGAIIAAAAWMSRDTVRSKVAE